VNYVLCDTVLGWVGVGLEDGRVCASTSPRARREEALEELAQRGVIEPADEREATGTVDLVRRWVEGEELDLGGRIDFSSGTAFQQAVWRALLEIPRGETRSYAWVARWVGRPGAARAVGQAVGVNPLPLLVPCHRVVASDGGLGGFGGGLEMKRTLLRWEGALP
jgi:methylated-DNA-[protein]-cysteine S-methyltransferase